MNKNIIILSTQLLCTTYLIAQTQTIAISNACLPISAILEKQNSPSTVGGKSWYGLYNYSQSVTINGSEEIVHDIIMYWDINTTQWIISFDGNAFFSNATNSPLPPSSLLSVWSNMDGTNCSGIIEVSNVVLPVELLSFYSKIEQDKIFLFFETAEEINNKGFSIEQSLDGLNFSTIGFQNATGSNSKYSFTAPIFESGICYYRLKQIDFDGGSSYSKIISVVNPQYKLLNFYPSLVQDGILHSKSEGKVFEIYNLVGQLVKQGITKNEIDISSLRNGTYVLILENFHFCFLKHS